MTITDVDQLNSLDIGAQVRVGDSDDMWTKTERGWSRGNFTLEPRHFAADIASNRVRTGPRYVAGQMWDEGRYGSVYVLVGERSEGVWDCIQLIPQYRSAPRRYETLVWGGIYQIRPNPQWTRVDSPPQWAALVAGAGQVAVAARANVQSLNEQILQANQRIAQLQNEAARANTIDRARLQERLHTYMRDHHEADDEMENLLAEFGMELPAQTIEVRITAYGTTNAGLDRATLDSVTPAGVEVDEANVDIPWRANLTATREVPAGQCVCAEYAGPQVRALLDAQGIEYDAVNDWEIECDNC